MFRLIDKPSSGGVETYVGVFYLIFKEYFSVP
jgi:hypothetical protein